MKKFDLHIHSTCSKHKIWGIDGIHTPREIVEKAISMGLDGIALTDHNTIKGSLKAIEYVREKKFSILIIPSAEIRSAKGDILALGINENIRPYMSVQATIDSIKDQGGIAIAAHPFKYNSDIGDLLKHSSNPIKFDAIEVFNSNIRKNANYRAEILAKELNLPGVAGSDAHHKMCIGMAMTGLEIDNLSVEDALKAITQNKIVLACQYMSVRDTAIVYFRKLAKMFKRVLRTQEKACD